MTLFARDESRRPRRPRRHVGDMLSAPIPNPIERLTHFFRETIWEDPPAPSLARRLVFPRLRVLTLVYWNYWAHGLARHAAALTYSSLLALVPVLAVGFSLFTAFGGLEEGGRVLREYVYDLLAPSAEIRGQIVEKLDPMLTAAQRRAEQGARGSALLGTLLLFVTVVNTLSWIESSFNEIFGIKRGRPLFQRFTVYWSVATLGPVLIGASLAMTASVKSSVFLRRLQEYVPAVEIAYRVAPVILTCAAFTLLYRFLPNAKVRFRAAIAGGLIGGLLFETSKWGFTKVAATLLASYSKVYGGIALLLVFFFWIWLSWMVLLIGCEFVVATQSATTHRREELAAQVSQKVREMIALRVVTEISERFYNGSPPVTAERLAVKLDIPLRLVYDVMSVLEAQGIVREVEEAPEEHSYLPARHIAKVSIYDVVRAMREDGAKGLSVRADEESRYLSRLVEEAEAASFRVYGEETLEKVVERLFEWRETSARHAALGDAPAPEPPPTPPADVPARRP